MTLREARRLGWTIHEGRKSQLVPDGEGYRVLRGFLSAEKVMTTAAGTPFTRHIAVETFELDGWRDLQERLAREIEKVEASAKEGAGAVEVAA